jgi:hypothetical protein
MPDLENLVEVDPQPAEHRFSNPIGVFLLKPLKERLVRLGPSRSSLEVRYEGPEEL